MFGLFDDIAGKTTAVAIWVVVGFVLGLWLAFGGQQYADMIKAQKSSPHARRTSSLMVWWYILRGETGFHGIEESAKRSGLRYRLRIGYFMFLLWFIGGIFVFS